MKRKIHWVSRHALSPAQERALKDLHGDVEVVHHQNVLFEDVDGVTSFVKEHSGFVYVVAGPQHTLHAMAWGCEFGVFANHHTKRQDGSFGLAAVYHVSQWWIDVVGEDGKRYSVNHPLLREVWVNPDPLSDRGESLKPVIG